MKIADYINMKSRLGVLLNVDGFRRWLADLRGLTSDPGIVRAIDRWIGRLRDLDPLTYLADIRDEIGDLYGIGLNLLNQARGGSTGSITSSIYDAVNAAIEAGKATWDTLFLDAQAKASKIEKDPDAHKTEAERFVAAMKASRKALDEMKPLLSAPGATAQDAARFNRLNAQYAELRNRVLEAGGQDVAGWPLVVIGVGLTIAAIAWAVSMAPYAEGHKLQSEAVLEDLRARIKASEEGRTIQPATVAPPTPPPTPPPSGPDIGKYLVPGAAIAGALGLVWWLGKGKRGGET